MAEVLTTRDPDALANQRQRPTLEDSDHDELDESRDPLEDSGCTRSVDSDDDDDEEQIEDVVAEDMQRLENSFRGISKRYRLMNRIGEGTFSTVYKAIDLEYDKYRNEWDLEEKENRRGPSGARKAKIRRKEHYVAIKKIYVTSSPQRIMNELELLHELRHCNTIAPLITAFRDRDQVIAVLPYCRHLDFRAYFKEFAIPDMKVYFRSLFRALASVHKQKIIHRDIKPTNFLWDINHKRGVLVDFGLAEREGTDYQPCLCEMSTEQRRQRVASSYVQTHEPVYGYPKGDQRPSLRANRAGTRGFRAPEVLFKCTAQTSKIDNWSAGIILLTILCKRFPFFNSADDIDAVIELATIFGRDRMRSAALAHGQVFETNIPTVGQKGHSLEKIIIWSQDRPGKQKDGAPTRLREDEAEAVAFLELILQLDPRRRITAEEALGHSFLLEEELGSENEMDCLSSPSY